MRMRLLNGWCIRYPVVNEPQAQKLNDTFPPPVLFLGCLFFLPQTQPPNQGGSQVSPLGGHESLETSSEAARLARQTLQLLVSPKNRSMETNIGPPVLLTDFEEEVSHVVFPHQVAFFAQAPPVALPDPAPPRPPTADFQE